MNCPYCKTPLPDGATTCPACGSAVDQQSNFDPLQSQSGYVQTQDQQSQNNYNSGQQQNYNGYAPGQQYQNTYNTNQHQYQNNYNTDQQYYNGYNPEQQYQSNYGQQTYQQPQSNYGQQTYQQPQSNYGQPAYQQPHNSYGQQTYQQPQSGFNNMPHRPTISSDSFIYTEKNGFNIGHFGVMIGNAILILSLLLPFASVSALGIKESVKLFDGSDGWVFLIAALIVTGLLFLHKEVLNIVLAAIQFLLVFVKVSDGKDLVSHYGYVAKFGAGYYLLILGGIIALVGAILGKILNKKIHG